MKLFSKKLGGQSLVRPETGAKNPEPIRTEDQFFAFLAKELPPENQLSKWMGRMKLERSTDLDGIVASLTVEIGFLSSRSTEFMVAEEAIRRVRSGEEPYHAWADKKDPDFRPLG